MVKHSVMNGSPDPHQRVRLLLTPRFLELVPDALGTIKTVQRVLPNIEAVGLPRVQDPELTRWCQRYGTAIVEWGKPEWMLKALNLFNPTLVYAGDLQDPLGLLSLSKGIPVMTLEDPLKNAASLPNNH